MSEWPDARCVKNGCDGCLGISLSCFHTFSCVKDPEFLNHRCGAAWTNVLWSLLMGATAFIVVFTLVHR